MQMRNTVSLCLLLKVLAVSVRKAMCTCPSYATTSNASRFSKLGLVKYLAHRGRNTLYSIVIKAKVLKRVLFCYLQRYNSQCTTLRDLLVHSFAGDVKFVHV